jgi:MFS family permease
VASTACSPAPEPDIQYDPSTLRFSGERAYAIEEEYVTTNTNRVSGSDELLQASVWLREEFSATGWTCAFDDWEAIIYSQTVLLRNVVCRLPGESEEEILVLAHNDIAPTTIQGADNDGSGIAILLHLAEIFAAEGKPRYTLVFVADDAEEFGMLGSRRFIETHPNPEKIIAGISLDNLGRYYYQDMVTELIGQYEGYSPIWIALTAKEAATAAGIDWEVINKGPIDQVLNQAITISFTDQGPIVAAGVPALGFGAGVPAEFRDEHYRLWHDPDDTMEHQSRHALEQSGLITEALIRQLLVMDSFPEQSGPYLYFEGSEQILSGLPLWLIFISFVGVFFAGSYLTSRDSLVKVGKQWLQALPHFLGLWLPLVASILLLYLLVAMRLMDEFTSYPGTTKDTSQLNPRWPAVIIFLVGTGVFLFIGRWLVHRFIGDKPVAEFRYIKSLAFLIIGVISLLILIIDPFALVFFIPVLFWFLIGGRRGFGKILDIFLFLLGGLMIYALIYFFGFQILRYGIVFLWYFISAISTGMFSFLDVAAGAAVMAAGLSMVVNPPHKSEKG